MAKPLIREIVDLHRAQLQGIIELRGIKKLKPLYEEARGELEERLARLKRAGRGQSFGAHHMRQVLVQATDTVRIMQGKLGGHLEKNGLLAAKLGQRHMVQAIKKLEKRFTGHAPVLEVEQAAVFQRVFKGVQPALLNRFKKSEALYGKPTVLAIRKQLSLSLLSGEGVDDAIDRVAGTSGVFEGQRWRAERIVRTELSHAYGVTQYRSMQETARELPDMKRKLIETFDDRTGVDSKRLHGQVRAMGDPFVYTPPLGKAGYPPFMMPPGRPNDRGLVIPWRDGWSAAGIKAPGEIDPRAPKDLDDDEGEI